MSWTAADVADAVWTNLVRTLDPGVPPLSNGSPVDNIAYAIWTYSTRTASGGVTSYQINVAQIMPAPGQSATLQTVMPVTVAQSAPVPVQTITAEVPASFEISVNQSMPAPSQSATAETPSAKKQQGGGGFAYYPPIYAIKINGHQEAPAPGQAAKAKYSPPRMVEAPEPIRAEYSIGGVEYTLAPSQGTRIKSHRAVTLRDREEQDIMALLASL